MSNTIVIQANVNGYKSRACTVIAGYSFKEGVLVIGEIRPYSSERVTDECLIITNSTSGDGDSYFDNDNFGDLIKAFDSFVVSSSSDIEDDGIRCIKYMDKAARSNPSSIIELDSISKSGANHRLDAQRLNNEQVAVLAICYIALQNENASLAGQDMDVCSRLGRGEIVTL